MQSKKKLLIVENDSYIALHTKQKVENLGYNISGIVADGEAAIEKVDHDPPDLILMDIKLNGQIDGVEAAKQINTKHNIPIIYVTAFADKDLLERVKITGPYGYIIKPYKELELHTAIEIALYKHEMEMKLLKSHWRLKENEEKYRVLFERDSDAIFIYDPETTNILDANNATSKMYGYSHDELIGMSCLKFSAEVKESASTIEKIRNDNEINVPHRIHFKKDGTNFPVDVSGYAITLRGKNLMFAVSQDITEDKKKTEALVKSQTELQNLATYLQNVIEQERTVVAREIHDELGQVMTSLKMDISWLGDKQKDPELSEKFLQIKEDIDQAISSVQRISTELRPGILDHLGLTAAIEWQVCEFQKRTGINCELKIESGDIRIDADCSTTIFRILQEALTNIIRHAKSKKVIVKFYLDKGCLHLDVLDNGIGMDIKKISTRPTYGLTGMRERVRALKGEVSIESTTGKGTTIRVMIPHKIQEKEL